MKIEEYQFLHVYSLHVIRLFVDMCDILWKKQLVSERKPEKVYTVCVT